MFYNTTDSETAFSLFGKNKLFAAPVRVTVYLISFDLNIVSSYRSCVYTTSIDIYHLHSLAMHLKEDTA